MKVSVITVCLNNQGTIVSAANSVLGQKHTDIEYLVIDGGSADGTLDRLKPYRHRIALLLSEPDRGIYDAMNKGLCRASGDVIGFLNADDWYADSDVLTRVAGVFSNPDVDICYGDLIYVDAASGRVLRNWRAGLYTRGSFYCGWMPPHPTFFVRRELYQRFGGYRLDLGTAADYELMLRYLLCQALRAAYIPRVLVVMRSGGASNVSLGNRLKAHGMDWRAWAVNGLFPPPWALLCKPLRKLGQWRT